MKINNLKGLKPFGHVNGNDDGPDFTDPRTFLNSVFGQSHQPAPPHSPPSHTPDPSHPGSGSGSGSGLGIGIQVRSVDGSGNNLVHSEFNQVPNKTDFVRIDKDGNFADGMSEM